MEIVKNKNFHPGRNCGQRTEKIQYIVLHYTGSEGTAQNNVTYFNGGNRNASAHYFAGRDGVICEYCDPAKWYAWHCGGSLESSHHPYYGKCTNANSIGIEICTHNNGSNWEFTTQAVNAAIELTKYLMQRFDIPAANVIRHYDVTGKACPRVPGWGAVGGSAEWDKFKKRIGGTMEVKDSTAKDATPKYYRVRKTWEDIDSQVGAYLFLKNAKEEADQRGNRYAVFDWTGKEIYRPAKKEKKESVEDGEIRFFYPGYTRHDSPDDRQGAGCIWHDQDGKVLVYDAYMKDSEPAKKMVQYLKDNDLEEVDTAVISHAHVDHGGGFIRMLEAGIKIRNFLCYDPDSLKLAGTGSGNARGVLEDKEYLQDLISLAKSKGATVRYIDDGDTVTCGEMVFDVYRDQPDHFTANDSGHGWAYTNDGSICLYEPDLCVLLVGDADGEHAADLCGVIYIVECGHHGNNGRASIVAKFKAKGLRLAIECNNEKNGPGTCSFTQFCAGRMIEAGVEVWQLDGDITGRATKGKMYVKKGKKSRSFDVAFGKTAKIASFAKDITEKTPTEQEIFIGKIGPLAREDMLKNGILASITLAQAILESGWGKSELAVNARNLFGMKKNLSGNTWSGSTWDGKSFYSKQTGEVYSGQRVTVQADFRAYDSWEQSVGDHSAYLIGAKNGSKLRYKGLVGCTDYKEAAQIIKDGGYATSPDYVQKLCRIIEQYDLTDWDWTPATPTDSRKLDDMHTVKWIGKAKAVCSGYLYPSATAKVTVDVPEGSAIGVCKGVGKFYLAKVGSKYGYVHRSHVKK